MLRTSFTLSSVGKWRVQMIIIAERMSGNLPDWILLGVNYIIQNFLHWNNLGGNFLGDNYPGWEFSGWEFFWVKKLLSGSIPAGNCPVGIICVANFRVGSFIVPNYVLNNFEIWTLLSNRKRCFVLFPVFSKSMTISAADWFYVQWNSGYIWNFIFLKISTLDNFLGSFGIGVSRNIFVAPLFLCIMTEDSGIFTKKYADRKRWRIQKPYHI